MSDPRPRARWSGALRWFAAEFLVVVTGVLVALALGAWWQDRENRRLERSYLRQLAADLARNEQLARSTAEASGRRILAGTRLQEAFRSATPAPPDSLDRWLSELFTATLLHPRTGTLDALIDTGDLNLVRSDSLRALLTDYRGTAEQVIAVVDEMSDLGLRSFAAVQERMDLWAVREGKAVHTAAHWAAAARDPAFRGQVYAVTVSHATRRRSATALLDATEALQRAVQDALE